MVLIWLPFEWILRVWKTDLVLRAFLCRGEGGREKTLASADHVISKHPEKLGVIIEHFIRGRELRREFKDLSAVKASFPNIPVMVLAERAQPHILKRLTVMCYTQLFWVFENHVISRCQGLFPLAFSSAENSPGNEVGEKQEKNFPHDLMTIFGP